MKLNIGCGKKFELGYCNIDLYENLIADKIMSALNLEFDENKIEEIKAIQVIEHLNFFEAIYALSEFFRVLKPNGKIIIEIPDLERACQHYLNSNTEDKKRVLDWIYGSPHKGLQHKFCFPSFLFIEILKKIGFINIKTSKFINYESIPTVRFECFKPGKFDDFEIFQILAIIRRRLNSDNCFDFSNSFLTKQFEDLLTLFAIKMHEFKKRKKKDIIFDIIIECLTKCPQFAKLLLRVMDTRKYISQIQIMRIDEITDLLIQLNFSNILCNSLKKAPLSPGTQRLVFFSINSFAMKIINKLIYNTNEKETIINKLKKIANENEYHEIPFFSSKLIELKSLDYFYIGIKSFYNEKYKMAYNNFLRAIQLYRDDFLYFWNIAKVLTILNKKGEALKFYKKTLICLRVTNILRKKEIKNDIKKEINWLKTKEDKIPKFEPIISIEKYQHSKFSSNPKIGLKP